MSLVHTQWTILLPWIDTEPDNDNTAVVETMTLSSLSSVEKALEFSYIRARANAKANFSFDLCRCSILYEPIWTWRRLRSNINKPKRAFLIYFSYESN